jgi:hypothetical protein
MRIRFHATVALACFVGVAWAAEPARAATIGPDSFGYIATDEDITYSFTDISGSASSALVNGDDSTTTQNIGFNFEFYGTTYTQVSWSPNGLMTFGGTDGDFANTDFATAGPGGNLPSIAVFWDDLQFFQSGSDQTYYGTYGSSGSQYFVIQWNLVSHFFNSNDPATFQVILYEGSNQILFLYDDISFGDSNFDYGATATVGIRDTSGESNGYNLVWSYDSASLSDGYAILFNPIPEPGTIALYGLGALGLAGVAFRRRRRRRAG